MRRVLALVPFAALSVGVIAAAVIPLTKNEIPRAQRIVSLPCGVGDGHGASAGVRRPSWPQHESLYGWRRAVDDREDGPGDHAERHRSEDHQ